MRRRCCYGQPSEQERGRKREIWRPAGKMKGGHRMSQTASANRSESWSFCLSRFTPLCLAEQSWLKQSSRWRRRSKTVKQRTRQPASISSKEAGCPIISWHAHEFSSQWGAGRLLPSTTTRMQRRHQPASDLLLMNGAVLRLDHCTSPRSLHGWSAARLLSALTRQNREKNINTDNKDGSSTGRAKLLPWRDDKETQAPVMRTQLRTWQQLLKTRTHILILYHQIHLLLHHLLLLFLH